jgi:hypothetical protein
VFHVEGLLEKVPQHALAVHLAVGQLAAHDPQLPIELVRVEGDVLHGVGHQVYRRVGLGRRAVDEVGRQVGRGEGVRGSAEAVDDPRDLLLGAAPGGPARDDVLEHVA